MSFWRSKARPIIARVLEETRGQSEGEIRRALRDAYPFGQRRYHPYKIWLDEIRRQRGTGEYAEGRTELEARIREIEEHNRRVEG